VTRPTPALAFACLIVLFVFTYGCAAQQAERNPFDRGLTEKFYDSLPDPGKRISPERRKEIYLDLLEQRKHCRNNDARCQAEIVTIIEYWQADKLVSKEKEYNDEFLLHHANLWFRTKVKQPAVILLIFLSYQQGLYGFPRDEKLAECWRELIKSEPPETIRETVEGCEALEIKKFGAKNPIVRSSN